MLNTSPMDLFAPANVRGAERSGSTRVEDMGSEDFLALMIAQMKHQDPTQPMDQMAFMSQMAQFGTVSGIQELNGSFNGLSDSISSGQAMQASSLVGRSVATPSSTGALAPIGLNSDGSPVYALKASIDMGAGADGGQFFVHNVQGDVVFTGNLPAGNGSVPVMWDGVDSDGHQLPPGDYYLSAELRNGSAVREGRVYGHEQVMSVSISGNNQITLNLASGRTIDAADVREFF